MLKRICDRCGDTMNWLSKGTSELFVYSGNDAHLCRKCTSTLIGWINDSMNMDEKAKNLSRSLGWDKNRV